MFSTRIASPVVAPAYAVGYAPGMLLTVDPGLRGCGCAWWVGPRGARVLHRAAYVPGLAHDPEDGKDEGAVACMAAVAAVVRATREVAASQLDVLALIAGSPSPSVEAVAVEWMKVYTRGEGDPADLVALSAIGGGVLASYPRALAIGLRPSEWKGQVPRAVMGARVEAKVRGTKPLPSGVTAPWSAVDPWTARSKDRLNDAMHAVGIGLFLFEHGRL